MLEIKTFESKNPLSQMKIEINLKEGEEKGKVFCV